MNNLKCFCVGAGAIGKSISGYIFSSLGYDVKFGEIDEAVIADINGRNGYNIYSADLEGNLNECKVRGISACNVYSNEAADFATESDIICTAVGSNNIPDVARCISKWLKPDKKKVILLFENGSGLTDLLTNTINEETGKKPDIYVAHGSIERITKKVYNNYAIDVIAEEFIKPVLTYSDVSGSVITEYESMFFFTDDMKRYYYRKLYLNNLGHALLGYMGLDKGYETTVEAVNDFDIRTALKNIWQDAGMMVKCLYNFTDKEIENYTAGRMTCYMNKSLADSLRRLSRSPIRKLGNHERITGTAALCMKYGIPVKSFAPVLYHAINYNDVYDPECVELKNMLRDEGLESVLLKVCGLQKDSLLFKEFYDGYMDYYISGMI